MSSEELNKYLLETNDLKSAIDRLERRELFNLDINVYERKIDGFYNALDYMLSSKKRVIVVKKEDADRLSVITAFLKNNYCPQCYFQHQFC